MAFRPVYLIASNSFCEAQPDFAKWIKPAEARRMSQLLKRSVASASIVTDEAGTAPDSVIVATGYGCWSNTEKILREMSADSAAAMPTAFMQSTHNTIASLLAIRNNWHGYNSTVSNGPLSFECAMMEAWVRFQLGKSSNLLLGAYDEVTDCLLDSMKSDYGDALECKPVYASFFLSDNNLREKAKVVIEEVLSEPLEDYPTLMAQLLQKNISRYIDASELSDFSLVEGAVGLMKVVDEVCASGGKGDRMAWVNTSSSNIMAIIVKAL